MQVIRNVAIVILMGLPALRAQADPIQADRASSHMARGINLYISGQFIESEAAFSAAITEGLETPATYGWRSYLRRKNEQLAGAKTDCDRAGSLGADDPMVDLCAGYLSVKAGNASAAVRRFDRGIRANPLLAALWLERGGGFLDLNNPQRAIQDYDQAIRLSPNFSAAFNDRGNAYKQVGPPQRAIQDYDAAIRLNPANHIAFFNRGVTNASFGQHQRALEDFDQAIRLHSTDADYFSDRCKAYRDLGQYVRAIADCDQAIRLDPNDFRAFDNRGVASPMIQVRSNVPFVILMKPSA